MPDVTIDAFGLTDIDRNLAALGPGFLARLLGPALGAAAAVVRRTSKVRNFGFTDRYGPRAAGSRWKSLRQSIRSRRIPAIYGGRKYKSGRAAVFAGGLGAQQAYLVEEGHGGPYPAEPHPYIGRALVSTRGEQLNRFAENVRRRFPALAEMAARRSTTGTQSVVARTVARRHRRR